MCVPGRRESFPLDSQIGGVCTGWLGVGWAFRRERANGIYLENERFGKTRDDAHRRVLQRHDDDISKLVGRYLRPITSGLPAFKNNMRERF